jgi:chromosome segregation protein
MRLKDAIELFAHSRIGARGMMIVNQGETDAFVLAKPHERRALLEEIFGLKGHRMKAEEAERKLVLIEENLTRAMIELEGLLPRLTILRREVERKKKQEDLKKKLSELHFDYFSLTKQFLKKEFFRIKEKREKLLTEESKLRERIQVFTQKLVLAENLEIQNLEKRIKEAKSEAEQREKEIVSLMSQMEQRLREAQTRLVLPTTHTSSLAEKKTDRETISQIVEEAEKAIEKGSLKAMTKGLSEIRKIGNDYLEASSKIKHPVVLEKKQVFLDFSLEKEKLLKAREARQEIIRSIKEMEEEKGKAYVALREKEREMDKEKDMLREVEYSLRDVEREEEEWQKKNESYQYELREAGIPDDFSLDKDEISQSDLVSVLDEKTKKRKRCMDELARIGLINESVLLEAKIAEERYASLSSETEDIRLAKDNLMKIIRELRGLVRKEFEEKFSLVKEKLEHNFLQIFKDGKIELFLTPEEGVDMRAELKHKGAKSVLSFSGGERSLLGIVALFALASVSAPPFLLFDEVDAPLDERNCRRFAELLEKMKKEMQFVLITHNRAVMEVADAIYGISMTPEGYSRVVSMKL